MVVNLLELIWVKKAIIQTIRPVEYKHLPVNLNTDNKNKLNKKLKELEDKMEKMTGQITQ